MIILTYILILVEIIVSILLIGIILIQKTKGQGMGLAFGGGMGETLFGSQVGNVLTKATVILAVIFLVNTTLLAVMGTGKTSTSIGDTIPETPAAAAMPMPVPEAPPMQPEIPPMDMTPLESVPVAAPTAAAGQDEPVPAESVPEPTAAP